VGDQKVCVQQETAIVELTSDIETVTMQFATETTETTATKAAWVMPVPSTAEIAVCQPGIFNYLARRPHRRRSGCTS
jgi:hypothetical protein